MQRTSALTLRLRWGGILHSGFSSAMRTSRWLISLMLPVSLGVTLLSFTGILGIASSWLDPLFRFLGLSGQSAFVFLTSIFLNIYSAIAVIETLPLTPREITILAFMCLVSHNIIVETLILKKTGSPALQIVLVRLGTSILGAVLLNHFLRESPITANGLQNIHAQPVEAGSLLSALQLWGIGAFWLSLKVLGFVTVLMVLQKALDEFGVIRLISRIVEPLLRPMGLPRETAFLWIVANVLGLGYSAAIIFDHHDKGHLDSRSTNLLNHHIAVSHSLLEDTLLFVAIGVSVFWITLPRLAFAILIVWGMRAFSSFQARKRATIA